MRRILPFALCVLLCFGLAEYGATKSVSVTPLQTTIAAATPQTIAHQAVRLKKNRKNKRKKSPQTDADQIKRWQRARNLWLILGLSVGFGLFLTIAFLAFAFTGFWFFGLVYGMLFSQPFLAFGIVAIILYKSFRRRIREAQENPTPTPTPLQPQQQDTVYLKNGSVIKGTVLHIIPNESIKIELAGGTILVYKMDEIDRIAKE